MNFPRLLFSGAVAFSALVAIASSYFLSFWHFNILSAAHWNLILQKWNAGWVLHKTGEYVFLCSLLAAPFVLAVFWYVCYKIRWARLWTAPLAPIKNIKKKALEKKSLQSAVGNPADLKKAPAPKHSAQKIPENCAVYAEHPSPPRCRPPRREQFSRIRARHAKAKRFPASAFGTVWPPNGKRREFTLCAN